MNPKAKIILELMAKIGELASRAAYKDWDFEPSEYEINDLKRLIEELEIPHED